MANFFTLGFGVENLLMFSDFEPGDTVDLVDLSEISAYILAYTFYAFIVLFTIPGFMLKKMKIGEYCITLFCIVFFVPIVVSAFVMILEPVVDVRLGGPWGWVLVAPFALALIPGGLALIANRSSADIRASTLGLAGTIVLLAAWPIRPVGTTLLMWSLFFFA